MAETQSGPRLIRFGAFEADIHTGELRKVGVKLKLSGQPFQVLAILLERPGEVVTREELQKRLWPDTFVDVERNLNTAINKIREVLGDSAESPQYVETLPRRGYRFIAQVDNGVAYPEPIVEVLRPSKPKIWKRPWAYGGVLLGLAVVTIASTVIWKVASTPLRAPKVVRFRKLTDDGQMKFGPLITDGSRIYFNERLPDGRMKIIQVSAQGGETSPLATPLKVPGVLDLSKDGAEMLVAEIGHYDQPRALWLQPVAGGSPRRIGTILAGDAAFGAGGTSIIYGNEHDVYSVSRDGAISKKVLAVAGTPSSFRFSPDTEVLRFTQFDDRRDTGTIMEAKADGTGLRELFRGESGEWTPDGRFFMFQNKVSGRFNLWALAEEKDSRWRKRDDKPTQLTAGPLDFETPMPSKDGKEIFAIGSAHRAEVIRFDSHTGDFVPFLHGISAKDLAFSMDGEWVCYTSVPEGTLWRSRVDGSEQLQLTFPPMQVLLPRWSPDGKQIAFSAILPEGAWNIFVIPSTGGTAQRILPSDQSQIDAGWSPDGNSLVFGTVWAPNAPISIIELKSKRLSTLPGSNGLFSPHWSPDGRYMSGSVSTGAMNLMLFDFSTQKWTKVTDLSAGYPNWSRDGKYLYFKSFDSWDYPFDIVRLRMSDRKIEKLADSRNIGRLTAGSFASWLGLAPDDSPLLARDISTQEIYALEMEWP